MTRVFISYSHDTDTHIEQVRQLADRLRGDGVESIIDLYSEPTVGWPTWMQQQIEASDFVVVVCTEGYCRKASRQLSGGRGVRFESVLIIDDLYHAGMENQRFLPVVLGEDDLDHIPSTLRSFTHYRLFEDDGYDLFYRRITGQPAFVAPPVRTGIRKRNPAPSAPIQSFSSSLLDSYKELVKSEHSCLIPFMEGLENELLKDVYVELALGTKEQAYADFSQEFPGDEIELHDLLELEASWATGRWVILGDPGAGKTTLLRHFVHGMAADSAAQWVPVFEPLARLAEEETFIFERIAKELETIEGEQASHFASILEGLAEEGRLLLVFDGLDEVPPEKNSDVRRRVEAFARKWPKTRIIVSSRPIGYKSLSSFREVNVLPFSQEKKLRFLSLWFGRKNGVTGEQASTEFLGILEAVPTLSELASIPLYLTLMVLLREQGKTPSRNLSVLYKQVLELLLNGQHHDPPTPIDYSEGARRALQYLAFEMTTDNVLSESISSLEARLYSKNAKAIREDLERRPQWKGKMRQFLEDEAKSGILSQHDLSNADWRFWHLTFREALTAERLARDLKAQGLDEILKLAKKIKGREGQWAEPFALLTGQIEDGDKVALALAKENQALGLRSLATARNVKDETIIKALKLGGDWKQRREVYKSIPGLVDDAERSLELLERLACQSRNGNDLFFIDFAVMGVAERWPEARQLCEARRQRLYGHIPEPPQELFQWIKTRDGRVPLWREIPSGSFLMGSPEEDEQALDSEKPRHEVMILSPLQIACVPVTQKQYSAFDPEHKSRYWGKRRPVEWITWYEAVSFCRWLASFPWAEGTRLPTEAEWEYACRAGTETRYWSGDTEEDLVQVGRLGNRTRPVGKKPANAWGLYDVHGNSAEWCGDWYGPYSSDSAEDPAGPEEGWQRVARGDSWPSDARVVRAAFRRGYSPGDRHHYLGFRLARGLRRGAP